MSSLQLSPPIHQVSSKAYVSSITAKKNIVLHATMARTKYTFTAEQYHDTAITQKWNITADKCAGHYIVGRDGTVYECFSDEYWSNHIGHGRKFSELNKSSIAVFLANELSLEKENSKYYAFGFNKPYNMYKGKVFEHRFNHGIYWADYDEQQIDSLVLLLAMLCEKHKLPTSLFSPSTSYRPEAFNRSAIVSCHNLNRDSSNLPLPLWVTNKLESSGFNLIR